MIRLERLTDERVEACARLYRDAYGQSPWNETYEPQAVEAYLREFMQAGALFGYVLTWDGQSAALALCVRLPGVGCPALRVEDLCVAPRFQRRGLGGKLLGLLEKEAAKLGADCVLLGTQRDFPSHAFYLKNGFSDVGGAVLMYREVRPTPSD